jgi:Family of unknown function (DUF6148)
MAGITLDHAQTQLDAWLAASLAVSRGQSYSIAGRSLSRVNAEHIQVMINYWQRHINTLKAKASGRRRTRYVVPMT